MNEIVNEFNDEARELEARLEELGKMICNVPNSSSSWNYVNQAIIELQQAIHDSYLMYED